MRIVLFALLALLAAIGNVVAEGEAPPQPTGRKLTPEEVDARAKKADEEIWHLGPGEFESRIQEGTWLIFFGARWCKFCKRLSPRWLGIQRQFLKDELVERDMNIAKVDCTDTDAWCSTQGVDAYPTIYLYHAGKFVEEYMGEHESTPIYEFILERTEHYESHSANEPADAHAQPPAVVVIEESEPEIVVVEVQGQAPDSRKVHEEL